MYYRPSRGFAWQAFGLPAILTIGLAGVGCATVDPSVADNSGTTPTAALSCEAGVGQAAENPISGTRFSAQLDAEMLMCPGGATARLVSQETIFGTGMMKIGCPDQELTVYIDAVGNRPECLPQPLFEIAPAASAQNRAAMAELRAGNFAKGLRLARRAAQLQKDSEAILSTVGTAEMANRQFADAERTLKKALDINPRSVTLRLAHAVCMSELGEKSVYAAEIFRLYDEIPESDPLHWELMCRVADNFNRIGNRDEAIG